MSEYERVLNTRDLGPGQMASVEVGGRPLVVVNVGQTYYALDASCPNGGTDLGAEGRLDGHLLVCPEDDWAYDVRSGERVLPEPGPSLSRYELRIEENSILVGPALNGGTAPPVFPDDV